MNRKQVLSMILFILVILGGRYLGVMSGAIFWFTPNPSIPEVTHSEFDFIKVFYL